MVHVVSCHHFVSQDVFLSNQEPLAFATAQGKIMVATSDHRINIHDLESRGNVLHSFATVDKVGQIAYCDVGNFIATLESKSVKHSNPVTYVRTYFNWWIDVSGQSMKFHIAGSSTSSSLSHNSCFEMVELPISETALCIACCRKTAILAVSLGKTISVFCYVKRCSKNLIQRQHDFSHFSDIDMNFTVQELSVSGSIFACMSNQEVQVFRISVEEEKDIDTGKISEMKNESLEKDESLSENFIEWRFESCSARGAADSQWETNLKGLIHPDSFPITVHLKAIDAENQKCAVIQNYEQLGPMLTVKGLTTQVKLNSKAFEQWPLLSSTNIDAVILIYRQFDFSAEDNKLLCLHLVDYYKSDYLAGRTLDPLNAAAAATEEGLSSMPCCSFSSKVQSQEKATACFFSTLNEGFLYGMTDQIGLISSFKYTSTLKCATLDQVFLHALTEAGLETYTSHLPQFVIPHFENPDGLKSTCPNYKWPVCLLGLRPFLGVGQILMSDEHLILVSCLEEADVESAEESSCTLYALKKPSPSQTFSDLLEISQVHKESDPAIYHAVLSEGNMILHSHKFLTNNSDAEIESLYLKSCILLADYYTCSSLSSEKMLASPYYHMSKLSLEEVVERVFSLQNQSKFSSVQKPLVQYLNSVLLERCSTETSNLTKSSSEMILDIYLDECPENLWKVILCSGITHFRIDKAILLLKRRITSKRHLLTASSVAADTLAIVHLLLKKGNTEASQNMLLSVSKNDLTNTFKEVYNVLWTKDGFSQLGKFAKQVRPDAFIEMMVQLVEDGSVKINDAIHVLENEDGEVETVPLFKEFLETLMNGSRDSFEGDSYCIAALVDIYLHRLAETTSNNGSSFLSVVKPNFMYGARPLWLNEMPPFNGRSVSRKCALLNNGLKKGNDKRIDNCVCCSCNEDLLRLQSLLQKKKSSTDVCSQVLEFLSSNPKTEGHLSLQILCLEEADAITKLLQDYPSALLQYAKDLFKNNEEKWSMLYQTVKENMDTIDKEHSNYDSYSKIFHGILGILSENMSICSFLSLVGGEEKSTLEAYVKRCLEKEQARGLRNKIVELGNEIKAMM